jgi:hypothetical protein
MNLRHQRHVRWRKFAMNMSQVGASYPHYGVERRKWPILMRYFQMQTCDMVATR